MKYILSAILVGSLFLVLVVYKPFDPSKCVGLPSFELSGGEKVLHKISKENVRVLGKWDIIYGNSKCERYRTRQYKIRFDDGAEITAAWNDLELLK